MQQLWCHNQNKIWKTDEHSKKGGSQSQTTDLEVKSAAPSVGTPSMESNCLLLWHPIWALHCLHPTRHGKQHFIILVWYRQEKSWQQNLAEVLHGWKPNFSRKMFRNFLQIVCCGVRNPCGPKASTRALNAHAFCLILTPMAKRPKKIKL